MEKEKRLTRFYGEPYNSDDQGLSCSRSFGTTGEGCYYQFVHIHFQIGVFARDVVSIGFELADGFTRNTKFLHLSNFPIVRHTIFVGVGQSRARSKVGITADIAL